MLLMISPLLPLRLLHAATSLITLFSCCHVMPPLFAVTLILMFSSDDTPMAAA